MSFDPESVTMLPKAHCPVCNATLDAASPSQNVPEPEPGDVSVCFYCTAFLVFNAEMIPESLSDSELNSLDSEIISELTRIRNAIKKSRARNCH